VTAGDAEFRDDAVDRCTAQLVGGDRAAYELLFRRRVTFVEAESTRVLGRRHDLAADAAQEAWLRVARAPRRCTTAAGLDAWLRRIVRSAAIDLLRSELARRCRERRVARMREEAADYLKDFELLEQIRHDASRLPAEDRSLLELVARTDATVASVAEWLGIGRAAADSRLRRAAERARQLRTNP
jgi:RNA polymerase sigma factor (sigma-70 family)